MDSKECPFCHSRLSSGPSIQLTESCFMHDVHLTCALDWLDRERSPQCICCDRELSFRDVERIKYEPRLVIKDLMDRSLYSALSSPRVLHQCAVEEETIMIASDPSGAFSNQQNEQVIMSLDDASVKFKGIIGWIYDMIYSRDSIPMQVKLDAQNCSDRPIMLEVTFKMLLIQGDEEREIRKEKTKTFSMEVDERVCITCSELFYSDKVAPGSTVAIMLKDIKVQY